MSGDLTSIVGRVLPVVYPDHAAMPAEWLGNARTLLHRTIAALDAAELLLPANAADVAIHDTHIECTHCGTHVHATTTTLAGLLDTARDHSCHPDDTDLEREGRRDDAVGH